MSQISTLFSFMYKFPRSYSSLHNLPSKQPTSNSPFLLFPQVSERVKLGPTPQPTMISPRKLMAMARKWQKMAGIGRRRKISLPKNRNTRIADKGHFVVYSMDKRRFMVPLTYLSSNIFIELLRMSEEEFGLPGDGPITLPFDAATMEYMVSMVGRHVSEELEKALLVSLANTTSLCFATASVYGGLRSRIIIQGL